MDASAYLPTALAALLLGAGLLVLLLAGLRWFRDRAPQAARHLPAPVPLGEPAGGAQAEAAVVMAEPGGVVVFANEPARTLFDLDGRPPHLDLLLRRAEPADRLLELFASAGQATLRVGQRQVEAASVRVPLPGGAPDRLVLVLREQAPAEAGAGRDQAAAPAPGSAEAILPALLAISQAVSAQLELEAVLNVIVEQVGRTFPASLIEVNLWDGPTQVLRPARHAGDLDYPRELERRGGAYAAGEGYSGWLARERRALRVEHVASFTAAKPKLIGPDFPFNAYMGVPLLAGEDLVGTLELASYTVGAFREGDQAFLELIAAQVALAIRNAQRYAEQQRRVAELSGLAEITRALEATSDPRELYRRLAGDIGRVMGAQMASLLVPDASGSQDTLLGQPPFHGMPDFVQEVCRLPLAPGSAITAFWQGTETWLSNATASDPAVEAMGLRDFVATTGTQTILLAPIAVGPRRLGVLQVGNKRDGRPFTADDARLLTLVAGQVGAILDNARLVSEARDRAEEADRLRSIAAAVANPDLNAGLAAAVQQAAELLRFDLGMVVLLDEARGELLPHPASVYGGPVEEAMAVRLSTDDPIFALSVTRSRRPFLTGRAHDDRRIVGFYRSLVEHFQVHSAMDAPLMAGDRCIGEMIVVARRHRAFSRAGLRQLEAIAAQIASAVERSQLYAATDQNLQRRVDQLTALSRVSRELNQTLDLERILRLVHDEVLRATRATCGTIVLLDPEAESAGPRVIRRLGDQELGLELTRLEAGVVRGEHAIRRLRSLDPDSALVAHAGVRSALIVPILAQGLVVGLIHLHSEQVDGFDEAAEDAAVALAVHTAIAVANAQRFDEQKRRSELLRHRADQLTQLFEVSSAVRSDLPLAANLEAIAFGLQEAVGFEVVLVSELDPKTRRLKRVTTTGLPLATVEAMAHVETPWHDIARVLRPEFLISQSYFLPRERAGHLRDGLPTVAVQPVAPPADVNPWHPDDLLVVPLVGSGKEPVGLLSVDNPRNGQRPDRGAIEIIEIFANQAAQAIENARLYAAAERRTSQLLALHRVVEAASAQADRRQVWQTVAQKLLAEMPGPEMCLIALQTGDSLAVLGRAGQLRPHLAFGPLLSGHSPVSEALAGGAPIVALDTAETDWALNAFVAALGVGSFICVPILSQGRPAGALFVGATTRPGRSSPFSAEDQDVFTVLANQLGAILDSARLEADVEQRAAQLAALAEVSQDITATLRAEDVAQAVLSGLASVVPYDGVALWLRDGESLRIAAAHGLQPAAFGSIPTGSDERPGPSVDIAGSALFAEMSETLAPILVPEVRADPRFAGGEFRPTQSWLAAPLVSKGHLLGVLALDKLEAHFYPPHATQVLMAFANQAAVALDNARLFAESEQRTQELDERSQRLGLLNRVSTQLSATLDEEQVFTIALREVAGALSTDRAVAIGFNASGDPQVLAQWPAAPAGAEPAEQAAALEVAQPGLAPAYPVVARVREMGAPLAIEDVITDPLLSESRADLAARGVKSLLVLPLAVAGQVLGVIQAEATRTPRRFTPGEIELAETLANQAAVALQNARFAQNLEQRVTIRTQELERERRRVETLLQITTELSSSLDLDLVLSRALQLVSDAIKADRGLIFLLDLETNRLVYRAALGRPKPLPPGGVPAPLKLGEGLIGWVIRKREGVIIADVEQDRRWAPLPDVEAGHRSALVVPLMASEDALGAIVLLSPLRDAFRDDQLRLVAAAANQVGAAINNAELYRLIRDQAERLGGMLRAQQVEATKSRAILEGIADGVLVADADGHVIVFNHACERVLDLEREAVLGRPLTGFVGIYGAAGRAWVQAIERWRDDPNSYRPGEFVAQRIDLDTQVIISVHLAPVIANEEYLGSVSVIRDVTREVEVDRLKSEFVSNVSHELRTPMTSIKGYADLLLLGAAGALLPHQSRYLEVIRSNADRLSLLVNDLLDVARIESGKAQLVLRPTPLGEVLQDVAAFVRGRSDQESKPMTVHVETEPGLPPVTADRERVRQIVMNLAENAFNYSPAGGTIALRARRSAGPPDELVVEVTDCGVGIAPEDQPRLFDRFYRGEHALVLASSGTGLGLSIARQLAEMHGGRLWLERSAPGQGSTFALALPFTDKG